MTKRIRLMLIEDDSRSAELIKEQLEWACGELCVEANIVVCVNHTSAINLLSKDTAYELIISDVDTEKGQDGINFVQNGENKEIPVVLMSGNDYAYDVAEFCRGADFIPKVSVEQNYMAPEIAFDLITRYSQEKIAPKVTEGLVEGSCVQRGQNVCK